MPLRSTDQPEKFGGLGERIVPEKPAPAAPRPEGPSGIVHDADGKARTTTHRREIDLAGGDVGMILRDGWNKAPTVPWTLSLLDKPIPLPRTVEELHAKQASDMQVIRDRLAELEREYRDALMGRALCRYTRKDGE